MATETLEDQLLKQGYSPYGPMAFSEIPEFMGQLENTYAFRRKSIRPIEEIRIIKASKTRVDCDEHPNLYMLYVIIAAEGGKNDKSK